MSVIARKLESAADEAADRIRELEQELADVESKLDAALDEIEELKFELAEFAS